MAEEPEEQNENTVQMMAVPLQDLQSIVNYLQRQVIEGQEAQVHLKRIILAMPIAPV